MVLGYAEETPRGRIETWYSRAGQVLRLRDGRLHSTMGFPVDWTSLHHEDLPSWAEVIKRRQTRFVRYRDEMPGYRVAVFDIVTIRETVTPEATRLRKLDPTQLHWFEEVTDDLSDGAPSARYALKASDGQTIWIYGEQCLALHFCLAWQRWPVTE